MPVYLDYKEQLDKLDSQDLLVYQGQQVYKVQQVQPVQVELLVNRVKWVGLVLQVPLELVEPKDQLDSLAVQVIQA
jgi:hypothetical protein